MLNDPFLKSLPKYDKKIFEEELKKSKELKNPTNLLYQQVLAIGKQVILKLVKSSSFYRRYVEDMASLINELSVEIILYILSNYDVIKNFYGCIYKSYRKRLLDLPDNLCCFSEHNRTRVRKLKQNKQLPKQQILTEQTCSIQPNLMIDFWDMLKTIAKNPIELQILHLRGLGKTEKEVANDLNLNQPQVSRILSKLYKQYLNYVKQLET